MSGPPTTNYIVSYISMANSSTAVCKENGKEGILVTSGTTAELTVLDQETYVVFVVCVSDSEGYTVNTYAPIMLLWNSK